MSDLASLQFRLAVPADLDALVALVESAYRGDTSRAGWTSEADLLDGQRTDEAEVSALIARENAAFLLAEREGVLVASLLLAKQGEGAYLGMFAVRPLLQGQGVGQKLLAEAERRAALVLGASHVRMTVIAQRPELISWYQRRGYVLTGEREAFPYGEPRFGLPRREDLYMLVMQKPL